MLMFIFSKEENSLLEIGKAHLKLYSEHTICSFGMSVPSTRVLVRIVHDIFAFYLYPGSQ